MAIKDLLVHLSDDPRSAVRLDLAVTLAARHQAHLTAVYVIPPPVVPGYDLAYIPTDVLNQQRENALAAAGKTEAAFGQATTGAGVAGEWRQVEGALGDSTELHARYADLVIAGQKTTERAAAHVYDVAEELVMVAGRPVITVPYAGDFKTLGERVLVAWDGTREATRAVHDALPILEQAKEVIVYWVNPPDSVPAPGADIAAHLARHGVKAEAHKTRSKLPENETAVLGARSVSPGDLILSAAADFSSDLIVMGAYAHSRFRELVLGGTTRYIFHHMTVPVLMSH